MQPQLNLLPPPSTPETEAPIIAHHPGWAEQEPESWWNYTRQASCKS